MVDVEDLKNRLAESPLRIGISTRALFELEAEHEVFCKQGLEAYCELQLSKEKETLNPGTGFDVVKRLLALNEPQGRSFVEVILLSRNSPDLSLRAFNSVEHYGLPIKTGSFVSGRQLGPFISAWSADLFLSNESTDVSAAVAAGTAAAKLGPRPKAAACDDLHPDEVRIAFDGDAVIFSGESDKVYAEQGLAAFLEHERAMASEPMSGGPFGNFLKKLSLLRSIYMRRDGTSQVRIAIVTARNAPAHARVVQTLRAWGTPADEAHFVGRNAKAPILSAFAAHIFFDDQEKHVLGASDSVPSGLVPGPHDPSRLIVPA